jgi:hypothetical protein
LSGHLHPFHFGYRHERGALLCPEIWVQATGSYFSSSAISRLSIRTSPSTSS